MYSAESAWAALVAFAEENDVETPAADGESELLYDPVANAVVVGRDDPVAVSRFQFDRVWNAALRDGRLSRENAGETPGISCASVVLALLVRATEFQDETDDSAVKPAERARE